MQIRCKDFIETPEGLIFAVLVNNTEQDRVLCFLRYLRIQTGFRKVGTGEANRLLTSDFPQYLFHSMRRDADIHGVPPTQIISHYRPVQRLQEIIQAEHHDPVEGKLVFLAKLLQNNGYSLARVGVTGSLLIGAQTAGSDIDLVLYDRDQFVRLRGFVRQAFNNKILAPLSEAQWQEAYRRRGCSLSPDEYIWHEKRKYNKASLSDTKIDFGLVSQNSDQECRSYRKIEAVEIIARVADDRFAFDHPARYPVSHPAIREIVSFTPTFAGQALAGETVIARGMLEEAENGTRRLVIGSSREAPEEYIKVARSAV